MATILRCFLCIGSLYFVYPQCNKWYDDVAMPVRFIENELVPDMAELPPSGKLSVTIFNGRSIGFYPGEELARWDFYQPPENFSWSTEPDTFYTLFFTTPDHPIDKKSKKGQLHHWLVGNIPGCDVWKGNVLIKYTPPMRYNGVGSCRYAFLVYKQTKPIQVIDKDEQMTGLKVNLTCADFAEKFGLGKLWAGNYFVIDH